LKKSFIWFFKKSKAKHEQILNLFKSFNFSLKSVLSEKTTALHTITKISPKKISQFINQEDEGDNRIFFSFKNSLGLENSRKINPNFPKRL